MRFKNILTRPTSVLLLITVIHAIVAVPASERLDVLALSSLTALGAGELMAMMIQLIKHEPVRTLYSSGLVSLGGFAGSVALFLGHSTVLFVTSMLLIATGVLAAARMPVEVNGGSPSPDRR